MNAQVIDSTNTSSRVGNQPMIHLRNGAVMPQFGLGVYAIKEGENAYNAVMTALKAGYRHIDTAHAYGNERSVGRVLRDSGIPRDSVWITSKLWPNEYGVDTTRAAVVRMLKRLGLDYIDMVYLHQPVGDYNGAWKDLVALLHEGKVKAIGISDFDYNDSLYNNFVDTMTVKPDCMQIESHPYAQRTHWAEKLKRDGIVLEAWFPLGGRESNGEILRDSTLNAIGKAHGKTAARVIIRWHLQEGHSVIPGSEIDWQIKENIQALDFRLSDAEMKQIRALNKEKRYFTTPFEEVRDRFAAYKIWD